MKAELITDNDPLPMGDPLDLRAHWPAGPWDEEPDREVWTDESTGIPCIVRRNPVGAWSGYVQVQPGHPWHGVDFGAGQAAPPGTEPDIHGGPTYGSAYRGDARDAEKLGDPSLAERDGSWWVGFDCAHSGDIVPATLVLHRMLGREPRAALPPPFTETYKTIAYAKEETARLAEQAWKLAPLPF